MSVTAVTFTEVTFTVVTYLSSRVGESRPESCPREHWDVDGMLSIFMSESRECRLLLLPLQFPVQQSQKCHNISQT